MSIIAINGYIGSGKDTVAKMIQYATCGITEYPGGARSFEECLEYWEDGYTGLPERRWDRVWEVKKFAAKLKQIVSLLTGIPVEDLEKPEVKALNLGEEWWSFRNPTGRHGGSKETFILPYRAQAVEMIGKGYIRKLTVRQLLQRLGTEGVRDNVHPDAWVTALFVDYKPWVYGGYPNWIISDCRFPNEAQAVKDRGGIVVRVTRDPSAIDNAPKHSSETSLDFWDFDYTIENSGTLEELYQKVKSMLIHFKLLPDERPN